MRENTRQHTVAEVQQYCCVELVTWVDLWKGLYCNGDKVARLKLGHTPVYAIYCNVVPIPTPWSS